MGHTHNHTHDHGSYYVDQILTILMCAGLGVVMILLWWNRVLGIFLDSKFHDPVLWGGIALLVLVAIRAISLFSPKGRAEGAHAHGDCCGHSHDCCHDHDHDHGAEHAHEHEHEHVAVAAGAVASGVDHHDEYHHEPEPPHVHEAAPEEAGCGHDHGSFPARYAVLLLPIVLFLMKIPWPEPPEAPEKANVLPVRLAEIEQSANDASARTLWKEQMETKSVRLKGKFESPWPGNQRFGFVRLRMTCCFADAYGEPVKIMVESPKPLDFGKYRGGWVKVIGKLDYRKLKDGDYIPVVKAESVTKISTPANQFDN